MTVDRSYLPYPSARHYQDRKMAKWMGFFLSEHQTALAKHAHPQNLPDKLAWDQILLYLGQAYSQQLPIQIDYLSSVHGQKEAVLAHSQGKVLSLSADRVDLTGPHTFKSIPLEQIIDLHMIEEEDYDPK
ncbi:hypothetical protein [Eremococcus coleocola]|uniref:YolD-like protein n=1 Tax=Eremococcus coleocola ACS-139-V-Col8 TaxID=908337 RepID=E4KPR7_9LACT|nr:hypothetical protein [Eremococcus coleocola]EFR31132.1 hypothetical protein HMPREF9257_1556 [Eremococcus coleocola ACS-139-V-Col8]